MEILGIGPLELVAILIIIFVVMGPSDMVKMGRTIGSTIRKIRTSGLWASFTQAQRQLRNLPDTLMREVAGDEVDQLRNEIKGEIDAHKGQIDELNRQFVAWTRDPEPQSQKKTPPPPDEQPPAAEAPEEPADDPTEGEDS